MMLKLGSLFAAGAIVAVGMTAAPAPAQAWWRGGYCCGVSFGFALPPIVVAPPVYAPPPAYYAPPPTYYAPPPVAYYQPPQRAWIPPHWQGNYWVPGHWSS